MKYLSSDPEYYSIIQLIYSDYSRYYQRKDKYSVLLKLFETILFGLNHCLLYSIYFRCASRKNIFQSFAKYKKFRIGRKYGIQIPSKTKIGPGLYIGHGIGIVINEKAIIGRNCNISQFLTIGSNKGTPAIIGDNVYIGPNVCIVEDVKIGNNVKIGAGTIVINDIPDNATSVGNPNRIILKSK